MKSMLLFLSLLAFFLVNSAFAASEKLDSVAAGISAQHDLQVAEKQRQDEDIALKRQELVKKRNMLKQQFDDEQNQLTRESAELKEIVGRRDKLRHEISSRLASKEELDNIFVDHVRTFLGLTENSPFSSEQGGRQQVLNAYLAGKHIFDLKDMSALLGMYFADIEAGRQNVRYQGKVLDRSGGEVKADIIRLGHIGAMFEREGEEGFLTFSPVSNRLLMSGRPDFFERRALSAFFTGKEDTTPIDISGGVAISELSHQEGLEERLKSGGFLVIPILLVGLAALVLIVERLFFLSKVRHNTDALMTKVTDLVIDGEYDQALQLTKPHSNRPTGKVLMAGLLHRDENNEVIESAISEAILSQAPRLERFISALKVLAAVAPLLGLLGTVTGMINTFQVITTHGTGDPRLMAGGISEAMITTQVGLAVAIPIMMIASFLASRVRNLSRDMEEKGIALLGALLRHNPAI